MKYYLAGLLNTYIFLCGFIFHSQIQAFVFNVLADPWVKKIPWRKAWQHTPVFLPGESNGERILAGYSPWGRRELDMTEAI